MDNENIFYTVTKEDLILWRDAIDSLECDDCKDHYNPPLCENCNIRLALQKLNELLGAK